MRGKPHSKRDAPIETNWQNNRDNGVAPLDKRVTLTMTTAIVHEVVIAIRATNTVEATGTTTKTATDERIRIKMTA